MGRYLATACPSPAYWTAYMDNPGHSQGIQALEGTPPCQGMAHRRARPRRMPGSKSPHIKAPKITKNSEYSASGYPCRRVASWCTARSTTYQLQQLPGPGSAQWWRTKQVTIPFIHFPFRQVFGCTRSWSLFKLELAKQLSTQRIAGPANKRHAFQAIHIHSPAHEVGLSNKRGRGPKPKP